MLGLVMQVLVLAVQNAVPTCAAGEPASSSVSRLVKIAPSTAVPSEPPMERKGVAPEVATPGSA